VTVHQLEWYCKKRRGFGSSGVVSYAGIARGGGINWFEDSVISGFHHDVDANCAPLGLAQPVVVIPYRGSGTTYQSHLQGSIIQVLL